VPRNGVESIVAAARNSLHAPASTACGCAYVNDMLDGCCLDALYTVSALECRHARLSGSRNCFFVEGSLRKCHKQFTSHLTPFDLAIGLGKVHPFTCQKHSGYTARGSSATSLPHCSPTQAHFHNGSHARGEMVADRTTSASHRILGKSAVVPASDARLSSQRVLTVPWSYWSEAVCLPSSAEGSRAQSGIL
jgi:hypothetical protein